MATMACLFACWDDVLLKFGQCSVNLRFRYASAAFQKVEVAPLVRLPGVLCKQPVIATRIISRWRLISLDALRDLRIAQVNVDRALGHIDADAIAGA
jgi:hypothetical protein